MLRSVLVDFGWMTGQRGCDSDSKPITFNNKEELRNMIVWMSVEVTVLCRVSALQRGPVVTRYRMPRPRTRAQSRRSIAFGVSIEQPSHHALDFSALKPTLTHGMERTSRVERLLSKLRCGVRTINRPLGLSTHTNTFFRYMLSFDNLFVRTLVTAIPAETWPSTLWLQVFHLVFSYYCTPEARVKAARAQASKLCRALLRRI